MRKFRYKTIVLILTITLLMPFSIVFGINTDTVFVWSNSVETATETNASESISPQEQTR